MLNTYCEHYIFVSSTMKKYKVDGRPRVVGAYVIVTNILYASN